MSNVHATRSHTTNRCYASLNSLNRESPMSRFASEWIALSITSLLANHPVVSELACARNQCQSAAMTSPVNLSFFLSSISRHWLYCYRQLAVSIVVSAIVFLVLVDNLMPCHLQIVQTELQTQAVCKLIPGMNPLAFIVKFRWFRSLHIVPVHKAV